MKKRKLSLTLLLLASVLTSCGVVESQSSNSSSESQFSSSSSEESSSSPNLEEKILLKGKVFNVALGNIVGAKVTFGDDTIVTDENGNYEFSYLKEESTIKGTLKVTLDGYDSVTKDIELIEDTNLDIELIRTPARVGMLSDDSFTLSTTRSSEGLKLIMSTTNLEWSNGDNFLQLFFSTRIDNPKLNADTYVLTHKASGHAFIHDRGERWRSFDMSDVIFNTYTKSGLLYIEYTIPFTKFGLSPSDVIGLSMTNSKNDNVVGTLIADVDNYLTMPEYPPFYIRIDEKNTSFINEYNCKVSDNPALGYDKDALIEGKNIRFALPGVAHTNADDIYVKVSKTDTSFVFDMVGFGSMDANEQIKVVLHTSAYDGKAWALQPTDLSILINKSTASYLIGETFLWNFAQISQGYLLTNQPTYITNSKGYFTYKLEVLFNEIPDYNEMVSVSMLMMEVLTDGSGYNEKWQIGMLKNNVPCGDGAMQENYVVIQ